MRVLVTGGLGFIGSNFINYILKNRPEIFVINVDKCDYMAREKNVEPTSRYKYVRADITDQYHMAYIFEQDKPDIVIHFAAQSCVDRSFDQAFLFTKDNVLGTHVLLETARNYGLLKKFIHISTDEVYGEIGPSGQSLETSPLNPSNPYSASKAAAELYVKAYGHCYNLPWIITRGNNVFGPRQYPEKVIPLFIQQIFERKECTIHGTGLTRRNFVYVDDVSRAVELIMDKGEITKTYNIGSSHEYSVLDIFEKISKIFGTGQARHVKDRPYNDSRYCIDSTELRNLGWSEDPDFDGRLKDTIYWYISHLGWFT